MASHGLLKQKTVAEFKNPLSHAFQNQLIEKISTKLTEVFDEMIKYANNKSPQEPQNLISDKHAKPKDLNTALMLAQNNLINLELLLLSQEFIQLDESTQLAKSNLAINIVYELKNLASDFLNENINPLNKRPLNNASVISHLENLQSVIQLAIKIDKNISLNAEGKGSTHLASFLKKLNHICEKEIKSMAKVVELRIYKVEIPLSVLGLELERSAKAKIKLTNLKKFEFKGGKALSAKFSIKSEFIKTEMQIQKGALVAVTDKDLEQTTKRKLPRYASFWAPKAKNIASATIFEMIADPVKSYLIIEGQLPQTYLKSGDNHFAVHNPHGHNILLEIPEDGTYNQELMTNLQAYIKDRTPGEYYHIAAGSRRNNPWTDEEIAQCEALFTELIHKPTEANLRDLLWDDTIDNQRDTDFDTDLSESESESDTDKQEILIEKIRQGLRQ